MEGSSHKSYHHEEFSSKNFYDTYFSADGNPPLQEEVVRFPMRQLHKELSSGNIKGKTLIELSPGPVMFKLMVCCEYFEEITVLEFNKNCSVELKNWLKKEPGALDWTHMLEFACSLDGKSEPTEKEKKLRERVKRVIDCEVSADPLVAPGSLPPADCVLSVWGIDIISKDKDDFCKNLGKLVSLLKPGGQLVLFGSICITLFKVGEHRVHILDYDEEFLRTALKAADLVIESLEKKPVADIGDHIICDCFVYVRARKVE